MKFLWDPGKLYEGHGGCVSCPSCSCLSGGRLYPGQLPQLGFRHFTMNQLQVSVLLLFHKMNCHIFDNFIFSVFFENIKFCKTKFCGSLISHGLSFFAIKVALIGSSKPI